jgi:probable rRNA maturation factor
MVEIPTSESNIQIRIPLIYRFHISPFQINKTLTLCRKYLAQKNNFDLSVVYTNNKKIKAINKKYRKIDEPTDVLSFCMESVDPGTGRINLGDIFISVPTANSQARKLKHSLTAELSLLLIHGYLHLNGFDHDTKSKKKIMWSIQDQIFSAIMSSKEK